MEFTGLFVALPIYGFLIVFTWYFQRSIIVSALKQHYYWVKEEEARDEDKIGYP
jgi:hypothetical protein